MIALKPQTRPDIEQTLDQLRDQIQSAVRAEQLVDQLTQLSNDDALNEWIQSQIDVGNEFWLAFVEVDHFKSVNDQFGYDLADELLRRIAEQLKNAAKNFFTKHATPFRAHGDEFFIGGPGDGTGVPEALDQIRTTIKALRVEASDQGKPMSCAVSIGWATSLDAQKTGKDLTRRSLRGMLETAVAEAKRERDRVLRYEPSMEKLAVREGRADCGACRAKFSVSVPIEDQRLTALCCPNCGGQVDRPVSLCSTA